MLENITELILQSIRTHGILAVILGVAIETIVVPLPSPLILMAAGSILIMPGPIWSVFLSALWISIVAGLAQTIGSYLLFFIGYFGGKPLIERFGKFFGVEWHEIEEFQKKFGKGRKEEVTLFLLRAIPIMPLSVVSGVAGLMEMDKKQYTIATFLGTIPRNLMLALSGFFFSEIYHVLAEKIDHAESIMTLLIILMIAAYIIGHKAGIFTRLRKRVLR